jgi:hypothetical protein
MLEKNAMPTTPEPLQLRVSTLSQQKTSSARQLSRPVEYRNRYQLAKPSSRTALPLGSSHLEGKSPRRPIRLGRG